MNAPARWHHYPVKSLRWGASSKWKWEPRGHDGNVECLQDLRKRNLHFCVCLTFDPWLIYLYQGKLNKSSWGEKNKTDFQWLGRGWRGAQQENHFRPLLGQQMRQEIPLVLTKPVCVGRMSVLTLGELLLSSTWNQSVSKNAESSLGIYSTIDTGAKEEDLYIETPINTNEK